MLHPAWIKILFVSFITVALCFAMISSFSRSYYKNTPMGRLSHSQLRVKQGNANIEQRLNVFVLSLLFSVTNLRILIITLLIAVAMNFILIS
ncbi:hypothetical protein [Desulforhopalus sp. 52FAK]